MPLAFKVIVWSPQSTLGVYVKDGMAIGTDEGFPTVFYKVPKNYWSSIKSLHSFLNVIET